MTTNTPLTDGTDPVADWMESLGFEKSLNDTATGGLWKMPAVAKKKIGYFVNAATAELFYQQMLEARDDAVKTKFSEMSVDQLHMVSGVIEGFIEDKSALHQRQKGTDHAK